MNTLTSHPFVCRRSLSMKWNVATMLAMLACLVVSLSSVSWAAVTDAVDFDAGQLTDSFAINVQTAPNPYSLAANGLAGTQGVDLGTSGDATLVYTGRSYDLSVVTALTVTCYFKKQATNSTGGTTALMLGLVGASGTRLNGYDQTGTTEDSFFSLQLQRNSTSLRFVALSKPGNTSTVTTGTSGSNLPLIDGNWYQLTAVFTRVDASTMRVSGSISNADANGNLGTLVASFPATSMSIADIAGDSQVWLALRGFATAGADAWDNMSIYAQGISTSVPAAPSSLTATPQPGYLVNLAWTDGSSNEDGFIISRATDESGPFTDIGTTGFNATSYVDASPPSVGRYFYKVRAFNSLGASAATVPVEAVSFRSRYRWKSVAIGGGGYITSIYLHPLAQNLVYLRTDVGGYYRWDAANTRWIPLTDSFTIDQRDYYGGEALALDPQDADVVYIACGTSLHTGAVFKSTDRGATWTKLPLNGISMHGNGTAKAMGERMVVSPFDSNLILFATRMNGIQRSTDGGQTWAKQTGMPDAAWVSGTGVTALLFDPQTSGLVYAGINGNGVWRSTDNGVTWTQIVGAPVDPQRMVVGTGGTLLVTCAAGVSRYSAGTWTTVAPGGSTVGFRAISVNPANRDDIIVADTNSSLTSPKTYRSSDSGLTWAEFQRPKTNTVPWLDSFRRGNPALSSMEFDPGVAGRVWLADWYGVWRTDNLNATPPQFTNPMQNLEECVVFTLCSPPSGAPLLSGVADNDGFRHATLDSFPTARYSGNQETHSIAAYAGNPARLVRAAGGRGGPYHVIVSTDGGVSWTNTNWSTAVPDARALQVAMAATDPNNILAITDSSLASGGSPKVTTDGGTTWQAVTGLPNGPSGVFSTSFPLASDPVLADTFYYHDGATGTLYRSTDKGLTFTAMNAAALLPTATNSLGLRTHPGVPGELWTCLDTSGLYRSTDGGATFTKITTVSRAIRCAFGLPLPGGTTPALYLYGTVNGYTVGVFRSHDLGQTWTELTDPGVAMGNGVAAFEASGQEYGLLFIGSSGRGIFYGRPLPTITALASGTPAAELNNAPGTFTISRDGDTGAALPVAFSLGGNASGGIDYTVPSSPVVLPIGATSSPVTIAPLSDSLAEGSETVQLSLTPSVDYLIGAKASLTLLDLPFDNWRAQWFTPTELNDSLISGPTADPNGNGLANLLDYAFQSNPKAAGGDTAPQVTTNTGHLALSFLRDKTNADLTYTVQVSDALSSWTDLAASSGGGTTSVLTPGTSVTETGAGTLKTVIVSDPVTLGDPAHPTRFLRLKVSR